MRKLLFAILAPSVIFISVAYASEAGRASRAAAPGAARVAAQMQPATAPAQTIAQTVIAPVVQNSATCRAEFRSCMDEFCLMDPIDGERCMCGEGIANAQAIQTEIDRITDETARIRNDDVEIARMTATERRLLGLDGSGTAARAERRNNLLSNLRADFGAGVNINAAVEGEAWFQVALRSCQSRLDACGPDAQMELELYRRLVANNCRDFERFLSDQRRDATNDRNTAQRELRDVRRDMLATTDRFNRGECLNAFRACVQERGGCGDNFENCLDRTLLTRRALACETIFDECNAVRADVQRDWQAEMTHILQIATRDAEVNRRATCRARVWACLEDSCSYDQNVQCLDNINVARGICPVIDECEAMIPGFITGITAQLRDQRARFCQNDVERCFVNLCGPNFDGPQCIGRRIDELRRYCPQAQIPSCRRMAVGDFRFITDSALFGMDLVLRDGCITHFSNMLGQICGIDMACLGVNLDIMNASSVDELIALNTPGARTPSPIMAWTNNEVNSIFNRLRNEATVASCRGNVGTHVFTSAQQIALSYAQQRVQRQFLSRLAELSAAASEAEARELCEVRMLANRRAIETGGNMADAEQEGIWILSAHFEPDTRNCRIDRLQRVCSEAGMTEAQAALIGAGGGLAGGAALGHMAVPGWGTAIGGAIGVIGGAFAGHRIGGVETACRDIPVTENINMGRR